MMPDLPRLFYPFRYAYPGVSETPPRRQRYCGRRPRVRVPTIRERGGEVLLLIALVAQRDNGLPL